MEGCGDGSVLGASGRDELNSNGTHLLAFGSDNKLAFTNTFFAFARWNISYVHGHMISRRDDQKRIDYILTRQAHRPRVHNVKVHPKPPPPRQGGFRP